MNKHYRVNSRNIITRRTGLSGDGATCLSHIDITGGFPPATLPPTGLSWVVSSQIQLAWLLLVHALQRRKQSNRALHSKHKWSPLVLTLWRQVNVTGGYEEQVPAIRPV